MSAFGMGASFNEPATDDNTSTPSMPSMPMSPAQPKKKKPYGPKVKNPGALAHAIASAKRAKQTGHRYGS